MCVLLVSSSVLVSSLHCNLFTSIRGQILQCMPKKVRRGTLGTSVVGYLKVHVQRMSYLSPKWYLDIRTWFGCPTDEVFSLGNLSNKHGSRQTWLSQSQERSALECNFAIYESLQDQGGSYLSSSEHYSGAHAGSWTDCHLYPRCQLTISHVLPNMPVLARSPKPKYVYRVQVLLDDVIESVSLEFSDNLSRLGTICSEGALLPTVKCFDGRVTGPIRHFAFCHPICCTDGRETNRHCQ